MNKILTSKVAFGINSKYRDFFVKMNSFYLLERRYAYNDIFILRRYIHSILLFWKEFFFDYDQQIFSGVVFFII